MSIPDVVIIAGPHPVRPHQRQPRGPVGGAARHGGHPRRAREGRGLPRRRRRRDHGPGAAGRRRPEPRQAVRRRGGHPVAGPRHDGQQGLPVRPRRHHRCRTADPPRRGIRRRGRRPGVDDQGAAPAARLAHGLAVRQRRDARPRCRTTASPTRSTTTRWARRPSASTRATDSPARSRTRSPPRRTCARAPPQAAGVFDAEIVPVEVPQRKGDPIVVAADEGVRPDSTVEVLGRLRPAFCRDGTITAGNSSPLSDGAAAVVVASREWAESRGCPGSPSSAPPARSPAPTTRCTRSRRTPSPRPSKRGRRGSDLDLVEINEAFAAVVAAVDARPRPLDRLVNMHGGAIALGHPIGASGARLAAARRARARRVAAAAAPRSRSAAAAVRARRCCSRADRAAPAAPVAA